MQSIDHAGLIMAMGGTIAAEKISAVNDNLDKAHFHNYFELLYLDHGVRYFIIEDRIYAAQEGDIVLFASNVMHNAYSDTDVKFQRTLVCFQLDEIEGEPVRAALQEGSGIYRITASRQSVISTLIRLLLEAQQSESDRRKPFMHSLLNTIVLCMMEYSTRPKERPPEERSIAMKVIRYIEEHYRESITLNELAAHFFVSKSYLCRAFKKYTNQTIIQYVNNTRIMMAQRRLMDTEDRIARISMDTGFENVTTFDRVFRQVTGVSPTQLRKRQRSSVREKCGKTAD